MCIHKNCQRDVYVCVFARTVDGGASYSFSVFSHFISTITLCDSNSEETSAAAHALVISFRELSSVHSFVVDDIVHLD